MQSRSTFNSAHYSVFVMVLMSLRCLMTWTIMIMSNSAQAGVYLGTRRVGTLGYRDGNTWFDYEDREPSHPVFGQAFETDPNRRRNASGTVPEWFANLLPERDSGLRSLIAEELGRENPHDFLAITFLGEDLPGAIRVVSETNLADIPELAKRDESRQDYQIRFSLAGIQPKFSMRWEGKGLVLPMSGQGGDWIVKLPDRRFPNVPENEYAMLYWARLAGMDVPETSLFEGEQLSGLPAGMIGDEEVAFGIKRFDRSGETRIHQEDFAQVREVAPDLKYERATYSGIGRFIRVSCPDDIDEYIRRLAAMVIMGNLDAHLKNWTIRYPDGRAARLSPAYDFVSVSVYPEFHRQQLAFAINGGRFANQVLPANFQRFAQRSGIEADRVLAVVKSTVASLVDLWLQVKADCDVPEFIRDHIEQRLTNLPLIHALTDF
jgi:serine/threonine-protein kinase HipA